MQAILDFLKSTGFYLLGDNPLNVVMILIACVLMYLAIVKKFEPLLLLPIAFGMMLTNLPGADLFHEILFAGGHVNWNLFGGACGNTYGHHAVWQMRRDPDAYCPNTWQTALHRPGAMWIRLYGDFIRENDLTGFVPVYDIVENNTHDCNYTAGMVSDRSAYLYIPCGIPVRLNRNVLPFKPVKAVLWEPTTGQYVQYGVQLTDDGLLSVPGRASGRGMDMVVILF